MLFRFSACRQWNHDFLRQGRFYVQPASAYRDLALDLARRDDELVTTWYDDSLSPRQYRAPNYYCMCFSATYDYRLFRDFNAVSCVAIDSPGELLLRIQRAIASRNKDGGVPQIGRVYAAPIVYMDPFFTTEPTDEMEVRFVKRFRYAYQTEFRFVLCPAVTDALEPFTLEIGSIEDIAHVVEAPMIGETGHQSLDDVEHEL